MLTNKIFDLLKSARVLTVGFLKSRSPDDLRVAISELRADLDKAALAASVVDFSELPPESVTFPISELRAKAALVVGDICTNRADLFVEKSITPAEFSAYLAAELAKAAEAPALDALGAGYSLLKRIDKAMAAFASFDAKAGDVETFVFCKEDAEEAAAVKKAAEEAIAKGEKAPAPTSWTPAPLAKADGTPGDAPAPADIAAEMTKARGIVEKARNEIRVSGGWGMDMATPRFLDGIGPKVDFGPDAKRP